MGDKASEAANGRPSGYICQIHPPELEVLRERTGRQISWDGLIKTKGNGETRDVSQRGGEERREKPDEG